MPKKPEESEGTTFTLETNSAIQSIWFDVMALSKHPTESVCEFNFFTRPSNRNGALIEASRLVTSEDHVKKMIEVICKTIDHYPKKPRPSRAKKKASK